MTRYQCPESRVKADPELEAQVLFPGLSQPHFNIVGSCVKLVGGHTKEFSPREEIQVNEHLLRAGFGDKEMSKYLQDETINDSKLLIQHKS
mmetsp:Transcript_3919/g.6651  ORF Transcript_3919/g.6651 Transcript_3919/m.6651 type:complete len:91 (+) Transcript_3919:1071-1343(+)